MHQGADNAATAQGIPSLGVGRGKFLPVHGRYEPALITQLLPGCRACGSAHPIALRAADETTCPGCGAPAGKPSNPVTDRAAVPGMAFRFARFLLWIGRTLDKLAKRI